MSLFKRRSSVQSSSEQANSADENRSSAQESLGASRRRFGKQLLQGSAVVAGIMLFPNAKISSTFGAANDRRTNDESDPSAMAQTTPIIRKEIRSLTAAELLRLRTAFAQLQQRTGANGYLDLGGYHGETRWLCPHANDLFLPWHRRYIWAVENALRSIDPTVSLPYWDWTSSQSRISGIPSAYSAQTYTTQTGQIRQNPLYSFFVPRLNRSTRRAPQSPTQLNSFATAVNLAMLETTYLNFNRAIERPHNSLHVWVGADMNTLGYAAFDPIFWAHHANVDRQWSQWQRSDVGGPIPSGVLSQSLPGFAGWTVAHVVDHRTQLNYEYAASPALSAPSMAQNGAADGRRWVLYAQVPTTAESFLVNVFINQPDANHTTALDGNIHYAGTFGIFGTGNMPRAHNQSGHNHTAPAVEREAVLDVTETMRRFEQDRITVKLVATDASGKPVPINKLPLKDVGIEPLAI